MKLKNKIIPAHKVPKLIKNNSFVIIGGNGGTGAPERILIEIEKNYIKKKRPKNLTIFHITGIGAVDKLGLNHLNHKGLVKKVIGGNYGLQIPFMKNLIVSNKIEAYNLPQGILSQLCRTMASKQPGIISKVGLKTYIDPRVEGGRMNKKTGAFRANGPYFWRSPIDYRITRSLSLKTYWQREGNGCAFFRC